MATNNGGKRFRLLKLDCEGAEWPILLTSQRLQLVDEICGEFHGFAEFAAGKPANVWLCLHQALRGEAEEQQMASLIQQHGIEERVFLNPLAGGVVGDHELNLLFNACDAGINTAMGEGWGLVSFEHAAAGAAQVVPDHTACSEIWRERGELSPLAKSYIPEFSILEMGEVSVAGIAQALENLYRSPRHHQQLAQAAFAVTQKAAAVSGERSHFFGREARNSLAPVM